MLSCTRTRSSRRTRCSTRSGAPSRRAREGLASELRVAPPQGARRAAARDEPGGYLLRVAPGELDAEAFERLAREARRRARRSGPSGSARRWGSGAGRRSPTSRTSRLRRGCDQRSRTRGERRARSSMDAELARGRHAEAAVELEALSPSTRSASVCGQLMLALYRSGRQAEALEVCRTARDDPREELGLEPSVRAPATRTGDPRDTTRRSGRRAVGRAEREPRPMVRKVCQGSLRRRRRLDASSGFERSMRRRCATVMGRFFAGDAARSPDATAGTLEKFSGDGGDGSSSACLPCTRIYALRAVRAAAEMRERAGPSSIAELERDHGVRARGPHRRQHRGGDRR